jgi:hypothetical protein
VFARLPEIRLDGGAQEGVSDAPRWSMGKRRRWDPRSPRWRRIARPSNPRAVGSCGTPTVPGTLPRTLK